MSPNDDNVSKQEIINDRSTLILNVTFWIFATGWILNSHFSKRVIFPDFAYDV